MADAFAAYDVLRLSMDGSNGGTTFTDASTPAHGNATVTGTITTSNGAARHGTCSATFPASTTTALSYATHSDWNFGSGDFCVDFWYKPTSIAALYQLFGISDGTTKPLGLRVNSGSPILDYKLSGQVAATISPTDVLVAGRWYHFAVVRYGATLTLYINGQAVGTAAVSTTALDFTSQIMAIGNNYTSGTGVSANGYIEAFRATKGHARYTAPFTPPIDLFNAVDQWTTTASIGTYSRQVSAYLSNNFDSVIAAVDAAIVGLGWTSYDTIYKGIVTRVFRCLNKDGSTYKYAIFRWDKPNQVCTMTSCESWDTSTHTPTNETNNGKGIYGRVPFAVDYCDIVIFGSTRWLGMLSYIATVPSDWALCVESEREAAEDTAAALVPCWGMTCGALAFGSGVTGTIIEAMVIYPRTKNGLTGSTARSTTCTKLLSWASYGAGGVNGTIGDNLCVSVIANVRHAWDTSKKVISSMRQSWIEGTTPNQNLTITGRFFGIKVSAVLGNQMDKVTGVPCNSDMFYAAGGSATDHWLLQMVYQHQAYQLIGATPAFPTYITFATTGITTVYCSVSTGRYIYVGSNTGVWKYDLLTSTWAAVASTGAAAILGMCFDGRYVYAGSTTGLYRIEVQNADAVTTLAITSGVQDVWWDGRNYLLTLIRNNANTGNRVDTTTWTASAAQSMGGTPVTGCLVAGLSCDGDKTFAYARGNLTTAADMAYGNFNIETLTGTFYALTAFLANCYGTTFFDGRFQVERSNQTEHYCTEHALGSASVLTTHASAAALTITNIVNAKMAPVNIGGVVHQLVPSTGLSNSNYYAHGGTSERLSGSAVQVGWVGETNAALAGRHMAPAHNCVFAISSAMVGYVLNNVFNKSFSNKGQSPQFLIPK